MMIEKVDVLIVGAGQAGLAMSEHLGNQGVDHLIVERDRIAQRWRIDRWDSLVANGPAWHDRFPTKTFDCTGPDGFPTKDGVVKYFEDFAKQINSPVRCGVEVLSAEPLPDDSGFIVKTSQGSIEARNIVAATGPFQIPNIPPVVPETDTILQMHSTAYRNPNQLPDGAVLIVGGGSSGSQISDELLRSGRDTYLSLGPHDRRPRTYRGKDFVWWLGALGHWQAKTPPEGSEHVTIAVSGAYGGYTIDFRDFAQRGMNLLGMTQNYENGTLNFAPDLANNIKQADSNYLQLLADADLYLKNSGLDFPLEEDAKLIGPDPDCMTNPTRMLNLEAAGISTIIWATGFTQDFGWLKVDAFDQNGKPDHKKGVSKASGIYFLGLPWLSMRGSSFIWGVWEDAKYLSQDIASRLSQSTLGS